MAAAESLPVLKRALRKRIQAALKVLPASSVASQSSALHSQIFSSPFYASSRALSVYLSMPHSEVQTMPIIQRALADGKSVFVPLITKGEATMRMVRIYEGEIEKGLEVDGWNIPIVSSSTQDGADREDALETSPPLDLILLPGVAFSPTPFSPLLSRLGHGKGYYDRFVSNYVQHCVTKACPAPKLVGLALNEQFLAEAAAVPTGPYDIGLDAVWRAGSEL